MLVTIWWCSSNISFILWLHSFQKPCKDTSPFFFQEKMAPYSPSRHDTVKVHHKNTLFHWKGFVSQSFLHVVPYSTCYLIFHIPLTHACSHSLTMASLLLICHELDFRFWKSSNWIFRERWNGEDITHSQKAGVGSYLWKSSDNLCRVCSVPLSRSLMTILTSTVPSISPLDTPLVTGVQLKFMSLITTL